MKKLVLSILLCSTSLTLLDARGGGGGSHRGEGRHSSGGGSRARSGGGNSFSGRPTGSSGLSSLRNFGSRSQTPSSPRISRATSPAPSRSNSQKPHTVNKPIKSSPKISSKPAPSKPRISRTNKPIQKPTIKRVNKPSSKSNISRASKSSTKPSVNRSSSKSNSRRNSHASFVSRGFRGHCNGWSGRDHWGRGWYGGFRSWGGGWGWGLCVWDPFFYSWGPSLAFWSLVLNGNRYYVPQAYVQNTYIIENKEITGWKGLDKNHDDSKVVLTVDDLYQSIKAGRKDLVLEIIKNSPLLCQAVNEAELSPLMSAIRYNQIEIALLLTQNKNTLLNCATKKGLTALHMAAEAGILPVVEAIAQARGDLNAQTTDESTPLHYALRKGKTDAALTLIKAGARTDIPDKNKKTAAQIAQDKKVKAVLELLNNNAQPGNTDEFGFNTNII